MYDSIWFPADTYKTDDTIRPHFENQEPRFPWKHRLRRKKQCICYQTGYVSVSSMNPVSGGFLLLTYNHLLSVINECSRGC